MFMPVVLSEKEKTPKPLDMGWFEPAFMGSYSDMLPVTLETFTHAGGFYDRAVAREPENMSFHQARVLSYIKAKLKPECYSALVDWLWVLKTTGSSTSLFEKTLAQVEDFLPSPEYIALQRSTLEEEALFSLPTGAVIAKGFSLGLPVVSNSSSG